jgi:hypothetical protein
MSLTPIQEAFLAKWLKKHSGPTAMPTRKPRCYKNAPNPKWNDDKWFEKQYGDPDYYKRIKGLD